MYSHHQREPFALSCCCCLVVKATKIIAIMDIVMALITIVFGGITLLNSIDDKDLRNSTLLRIGLEGGTIFVAALLLHFSTNKRQAWACMPYIIYKILLIFIAAGATAWMIKEDETPPVLTLVITALGIIFAIYEIATVIHCFMYLRSQPNHPPAVPQQRIVPIGYHGYGPGPGYNRHPRYGQPPVYSHSPVDGQAYVNAPNGYNEQQYTSSHEGTSQHMRPTLGYPDQQGTPQTISGMPVAVSPQVPPNAPGHGLESSTMTAQISN